MRILFFSFFIFGVIQAQAQQYTGEFNRPFFPKSGQSEFSLMYNYLSIESEDEQSGVPVNLDGNFSGLSVGYNYSLLDNLVIGAKLGNGTGDIDLQFGSNDVQLKMKGLRRLLVQIQGFMQLGSMSKIYYGLGYGWEPEDHENKTLSNNEIELTAATGQDALKVNTGFGVNLGSSILFGTNIEYYKMMNGQESDNQLGVITQVDVNGGDYYVISPYLELPQWSHLTLFAAYSKQNDLESEGQVYRDSTQVRSYGMTAEFALSNNFSLIPQVNVVIPDILLDMMTSKDKNKMVNASLQMRLLF